MKKSFFASIMLALLAFFIFDPPPAKANSNKAKPAKAFKQKTTDILVWNAWTKPAGLNVVMDRYGTRTSSIDNKLLHSIYGKNKPSANISYNGNMAEAIPKKGINVTRTDIIEDGSGKLFFA